MSLNFIRGVVSQDLKRHVEDEWDLNLTYILNNLIAMSYPGEGVEGMYRNDINHVAAYLDSKHQGHYMIFNLSERIYNVEVFHGRVVDFGWPDHHGPPLQVLIDAVMELHRWLSADVRNVAIVHCLAGRGRTGTLICSYLCFAGYFAKMSESLRYYANARSVKSKGVTQPSQLRYCKYVDLILNRNLIPRPKCIRISKFILSPVPSFTSQFGIRPILNVYRYSPGSQILIWTSQKPNTEAPHFLPQDGQVTFELSDMPPLAGDIMIKLFHISSWLWVSTNVECICRIVLNTSFLADKQDVLTLRKMDLDIAHKDIRFADDSQIHISTSVVPDGPKPSKEEWDPEKFAEWAAEAKRYREKLLPKTSSSSHPSSTVSTPTSSANQSMSNLPDSFAVSPSSSSPSLSISDFQDIVVDSPPPEAASSSNESNDTIPIVSLSSPPTPLPMAHDDPLQLGMEHPLSASTEQLPF